MPHQNSLGIFLRTLLLLAALLVVGCGGAESDVTAGTAELTSVVPSPDDTADMPRATLTSTPVWPTPEIIPDATATPTPTPGSAGSSTRRIIFILDHSNSVVNECFTYPQNPAHSEARRAMRDMVIFLTDLLGEWQRAAAAPPFTIEVGVYTLHPYADPWTPQPPRELLAVQNVAALRAGWDEPMAALLDAASLDAYGWNIAWLGGADGISSILAQDGTTRNMVILLTDGYTGQPTSAEAAPTRSAPDMRGELRDQLETLHALPGALDFNVVRFNCPELTDELGTPRADQPNAYDKEEAVFNDASMWQELEERQEDGNPGIRLHIQNLPRSAPTPAATHYDEAAYWNSFALIINNLLTQLEIDALWPPVVQTGQYRPAGHGWLPSAESDGSTTTAPCDSPADDATASPQRLPTRATPACLPGNTATFALRVVAAAGQPGGYSVFFRRGGQTFRRTLHDANAGHVYTIDPADHALREVLAADSELCGPIEWWIEGPDAVSFYWWETQPARYSVFPKLEETAIENNERILVNFKVEEEVAEPGNAGCYELRIMLNTAAGGQLVEHIQLRDIYPALRGSVEFKNYPFNPTAHTPLSVSLDFVENLNRPAGENMQPPGPAAHSAVVATGTPMAITNEYIPRFSGTVVVYNDGCRTDEAEETREPEGTKEPTISSLSESGCYFEIIFDFADENYWLEGVPTALFVALNTQAPSDVGEPIDGSDSKLCNRLTALHSKSLQSQSDEENRYQSGQDLMTWAEATPQEDVTSYEEVVALDSPWRVFSINLISDDILETCGFEAILIQWQNHKDWPAVLCKQTGNYTVDCQETQMDWE